MAAAGYMSETDVEGIWDTAWDTTRFNLINVRVAEIINFLLSGNATTQITNTAVLPVLEQISEEILLELAAKAKGTDVINPWDFIQANLSKIDWKFYDNYLLKKVRQTLGHETMEFTTSKLPNTKTWNVIP